MMEGRDVESSFLESERPAVSIEAQRCGQPLDFRDALAQENGSGLLFGS